MHTTHDSDREVPARLLALMVAANGRIDERELHALDELGAFERLRVARARFVEMARECLEQQGEPPCDLPWLRSFDRLDVDRLLGAVVEPQHRLLLCRLAAAVITADGRVSDDERAVYDQMLTRWRVSPQMVARAIRSYAPPLTGAVPACDSQVSV